MAGLLDIFGSSGSQTLGLLGMSPEDVQRARDDAQAQAMYTLAGRLFQGGNTGRSIAEGLQLGQQAYKQAMQGQLAETLQGAQIQEMLRQRQEAQAVKQRQEAVNRIIAQAYQPAVAAAPNAFYGTETQMPLRDEEGNLMPGATPAVQARPAQFDLTGATPLLMAMPEGRKALTEIVAAQKAMQPELKSVPPESILGYMKDGNFVQVASGAPKAEKLTGIEADAALLLYGTADIGKIRAIPGAVDAIRKEAITQRNASKPVINMSDPTAVQTQMLKTINQWEGVLKDSGATEISNRANGFYNAYEKARKGNTNADGALIYNVAKLYDPGGVVQAGDINSVIGVRSIPDVIQKAAQTVSKGGTLLPKERDNLKAIIDDIVETRQKAIEPSLKTYQKINRSLGGTDDAITNPLALIRKPRSLDQILGDQ